MFSWINYHIIRLFACKVSIVCIIHLSPLCVTNVSLTQKHVQVDLLDHSVLIIVSCGEHLGSSTESPVLYKVDYSSYKIKLIFGLERIRPIMVLTVVLVLGFGGIGSLRCAVVYN